MQAGRESAWERTSIQSTARDRPVVAGSGRRMAAPAPSLSIQRRNSASKGRRPLASRMPAASRTLARRWRLANSLAQATAVSAAPAATWAQAALSAATPPAQTPPKLAMSQGPMPASPWTRLAKPGTRTSLRVVAAVR